MQSSRIKYLLKGPRIISRHLSEDYLKPSGKDHESLKKEVEGEIKELNLENKTINLRN